MMVTVICPDSNYQIRALLFELGYGSNALFLRLKRDEFKDRTRNISG